jgi:hypothetical protein
MPSGSKRWKEPTLELLQIHSLDIAPSQIFYVGDESVSILLRVLREPGDKLLELRIGPRVAS